MGGDLEIKRRSSVPDIQANPSAGKERGKLCERVGGGKRRLRKGRGTLGARLGSERRLPPAGDLMNNPGASSWAWLSAGHQAQHCDQGGAQPF